MKKPLSFFYSFSIRTAIVTVLFTAINFFANGQDCGCDHVIEPPADRITSTFVYGDSLGIKPGQTVCLKAGFYFQIRFTNVVGEPGNPVTIKNCGGLVQIGDDVNHGRWYATDIVRCGYLRLTGTGDPAYKYGIKLGRSGDSGLKMGLSTDAELDHLEIGNANFAGMLIKADYAGNPPAYAPEMNNVKIHDNYVHDSRGEGMYIGETKSPGQNFRHLEIWNNIVTRSGLESIQVANVVEDIKAHNNVFYTSGLRNLVGQNKGFQIGDNSVGQYYNNFIIGSASNSMIVLGSGNIEVFNNYMAGAGNPGFFIDNRSFSIPGAPINIHHNFLMEVNPIFPFFNVFNEINPVNNTHNNVEGSNVLYGVDSGAGALVTVSDNTTQVIERVQFTDVTTGNFTHDPGSPYQDLGLVDDASNRNARPFITLIPDQKFDFGSRYEVAVSATDPDADAIILEAFNLPSFVTFKDNGGGKGMFILEPQETDMGWYFKARLRATDSNGGMYSQNFSIKVLDPYAFIATASASLDNNLPQNTLDNDLATRWAAPEGEGHWIKYDLREDKLVTSVKIAFFNGVSAVYPFDIEVSQDNVVWNRVFSGASTGTTGDFETFTFAQVRARHLRINSSASSLNSYNEVVIDCTTAPEFHPVIASDDVYIDGRRIYNNNTLKVKSSGVKSFLRFTVSDLDVAKSPVTSAILKIKALESRYGTLRIYLGSETAWTENNPWPWNLPYAVKIMHSITTNFIKGQVYELNVRGAVADNGAYNFILAFENSNKGLSFSSTEGIFKPELTVETLRGATVDPIASPLQPYSTTRSDINEASKSDNSQGRIKLFPNPVIDKVTIDLGVEQSTFVIVEIFDGEGKPFFRNSWMNVNQFIDLDLSSAYMNPGFYFVKIKQDDGSVKTLRMIKK
ncbi:MAG: discoidin domain-containing protein [Cyclobacteriaceae bacterium]